jgi:cardiolipin synthase
MLPAKEQIPNALTIFRIVLIPILVGTFYMTGKLSHYVAAAIFIFASITDYVDGLLARKLHAHSNFGRMLDPIADKMLVATALMLLVHFHRAPILPALAILCREILISGLREYLAEIRVNVPVGQLAKIKTAVQMIAITLLLLDEKGTGIQNIYYIGAFALWIAALLTLMTGYAYCKEGIKHIE